MEPVAVDVSESLTLALRAARGHAVLPAFEALALEIQRKLQALPSRDPELRVQARVHQKKGFDLRFVHDPFQATVSQEVLGDAQAVYFCGPPTARRASDHQRDDRRRREAEYQRKLEQCPPGVEPRPLASPLTRAIAAHGLDSLRELLTAQQTEELLGSLAEKLLAKLQRAVPVAAPDPGVRIASVTTEQANP